jgi:hypothetical protein
VAQMVSLKLTPKEAKDEVTPSSDPPAYDYGTSISLNDAALTKLGLKDMPAVGVVMTMECRVEVSGTSAYDSQSGTERTLSLQITDMALHGGGKPGAQTLYDHATSRPDKAK